MNQKFFWRSAATADYDGNVGGGFLKPFVVTFDYGRQIMYLKKVIPAPADAGEFDKAGLWINAGVDGLKVVDLSPGGPAELAGLAVGDVITAIDGSPVLPVALSDARKRLRALAPGTRVKIARNRAGAPAVIVLTLRDPLGGHDSESPRSSTRISASRCSTRSTNPSQDQRTCGVRLHQ